MAHRMWEVALGCGLRLDSAWNLGLSPTNAPKEREVGSLGCIDMIQSSKEHQTPSSYPLFLQKKVGGPGVKHGILASQHATDLMGTCPLSTPLCP